MIAPLWTSAEARDATRGRSSGPDWQAGGVSIDSRAVAPGDLFVALAGPHHDGHDYVAQALADGAAAALVHKIPAGLPADAPLLLVEDTLDGLVALAAAARARSGAKVVAVTGSVGKTSTKEMLKLALEAGGPTHANVGSLNNHWGVPLSLARLPREARTAVFELGMNHAGELTPLSRLVRPHVAVITTVDAVHMEFFASTAAIAEAKAEILAGVEPGGTAILPRDNPHFALLRQAALQHSIRHIESFGNHIESSARLLDCAVDPEATLVFAMVGETALSYRIGVPGRQWAMNSLPVLLAAAAAGVPMAAAARALAAMTAPKGRGRRQRLAWGEGRIELIDESYNASPVSVRAALATLAAAKSARRRVAVLGDMLELGETAPALHAGLAEAAMDLGIDILFTAGPLMRRLHDALPADRRGGHAENAAASASQVIAALRAGDVVVVKGSAGSRMGLVVKALEEEAAARQPAHSGQEVS
ncbi:UDP-N-acetylmuramoyl-tripeptide--D-alanyl-D-alanine ligase [mine drainage metagenome]|uniref:UDP-MurNAc-pentapeptide synthetase n=1 Tax=mine drainage metagenome TaxID=410659 RepID=A0A1J5SND3_9ZZZZ